MNLSQDSEILGAEKLNDRPNGAHLWRWPRLTMVCRSCRGPRAHGPVVIVSDLRLQVGLQLLVPLRRRGFASCALSILLEQQVNEVDATSVRVTLTNTSAIVSSVVWLLGWFLVQIEGTSA